MSYLREQHEDNVIMAAKIALREAGIEPTIENIDYYDDMCYLLVYKYNCVDNDYIRLSIPGDLKRVDKFNGKEYPVYETKIDIAVDIDSFEVIKDRKKIERILDQGVALDEELIKPLGADSKYLNMLPCAFSQGYIGSL